MGARLCVSHRDKQDERRQSGAEEKRSERFGHPKFVLPDSDSPTFTEEQV